MSNFEEDFSWLPSVDDTLDFEVDDKYHIKSGNNWETYTYDHPQVQVIDGENLLTKI